MPMVRVTDIMAATRAITADITAAMRRLTMADITTSLTIPSFAIAASYARHMPTMVVRGSMVRGSTIAATGIIGDASNRKGRQQGGPFLMDNASVDQSISCTTVRVAGSTSITRLFE